MRFYSFFVLFSVLNSFCFSQSYNVSSYQKINELNGGFYGGLNNGDNYGISIDNIGDLDGNGINDLAVGAYRDDDGGTDKGAVWILFLDENDLVISHTKISDTSGGFTGILDNDDRFGGAVSYLGDLNNDGLIELAVGADYDGDGGYWHGAVWILSLNSDGTVSSHSKISDTQGNFTGYLDDYSIFGTDIENIGDLNGDGIQDIVVGSRRLGGVDISRGAIWILFMNSDMTVNYHQKIGHNEGGFGSLGIADYFGASVANIGDLNGDGVVDLAVGAYRDDDQMTNSGCIYVLFLNTDGTVNTYQKLSNLYGGLNSEISSEALFGESVDGVVDIDADGKMEIIVGAMKQENPTLSVATGGFFIIELNSDGTVSEEFFYSYGENCFSGSLENGDLFGGAVCFLNGDSDNLKIAVGAYRDSEGGYQKGAAWILNLGETSFNIGALSNPTGCGSEDGSITISGLTPSTEYQISYNDGFPQEQTLYSNVDGELVLGGLGGGVYSSIEVVDNLTGCSDNLEDVELIGAQGVSATISYTGPTGCGLEDGSITISGLTPSTEYQISYNDGFPQEQTLYSNVDGELVLEGLGEGVYSSIEVVDNLTGCSDTMEDVELIGAQGVSATISYMGPTGCGLEDGSITISGLTPSTEYQISYNDGFPQEQTLYSNVDGELVLEGLGEGVYSSIEVVDNLTGCSDNLEDVELIGAQGVSATISYTGPTGCGLEDGSITISGLTPSTEYQISYNDGFPQEQTLYSNVDGELVLEGLGEGVYSSIEVVDNLTGCSDTMEDVELIGAQGVSATISYMGPTGCGLEDGSITISGLTPSTEYQISYNDGFPQEQTLYSNVDGELVLEGLGEGVYSSIEVVDNLTGCSDNLEDVELIGAQGVSATISYMDPTGCGLEDGSITISGLTPSTEYQISYNDGFPQEQSLYSNVDGELVLEGLGEGVYSSIEVVDNLTGCSDTMEDVELIGAQGVSATISYMGPTGCGLEDGSITISGLTPSTEYQISYNDGFPQEQTLYSNVDGELVLEGLGEGVYSSIEVVDNLTGCSDNLEDVELIGAQGVSATISYMDPTGCGLEDGSITISGLTPSTEYQISYNDGFPQEQSLYSNVDGELVLEGLGEGVYSSIEVVDNLTGCSDTMEDVELIGGLGLSATISYMDPTGCGLEDGSITISGLTPSTEYQISYNDGFPQEQTLSSDIEGELVVLDLSVGIYEDITILEIETGCFVSLGQVNLNCEELAGKCFKTKKFFTPNNDGFNDFWSLELLSQNCSYELYIFDRFGKMIKILTPHNYFWDGLNVKGHPMPTSDYWYLVNYRINGNDEMTFTSHFTLKR
ncbi:T9SS type B sorting domain-containing protein [Mangrovimonas sp. YM274]|uniref:T9SS type B sorting domain-containing protein n=1 Tax=Mangrovimonas sp. YM274 TaxID=3070660 RepID=UPI0027DCD053|nr:T9SS type B sorting domain-containing protein [Mangrovimonas sp. YM274]WMI69671.1 T9SS type B sorting domain-containing protein [Mangrovimonas sp. YM274]